MLNSPPKLWIRPFEEHGIDGGKKVKGHKRHIVVDIPGNLLFVMAYAANLKDTKSAGEVVDKWPSLTDAGYCDTAVTFYTEKLNKPLHVPKKIKDGWAVLRKLERIFSWIFCQAASYCHKTAKPII